MGLQDREYFQRRQPGGIGAVRMWSVTTWLLVVNIVVFVVDAAIRRANARVIEFEGVQVAMVMGDSWLEKWGAFTLEEGILRGQVWRLLTFQFLHAGIWHLVMNMFALWMLGPVVELNLGSRRYALFYFVCGIAGPVAYALLWVTGILMPGGGRGYLPGLMTPMVGASAGIFGVLMAAAYLSPDRMIYVYFVELPLKVVAWVLVVMALYAVVTNGRNAGGEAAHLGGGFLGFVLIRHERWMDFFVPRKRMVRGRKVKDWSRDFNR
jgi:membrane associated rhomboid family serine protease